ncbi:MAG: hypothetical protein V1850_01535 [Candidatus Bathyarchaeota archaeon]
MVSKNKPEKLAEELGANFTIVKPLPKVEATDKSITGEDEENHRWRGREIEVKADTLSTFISLSLTVLFQKEKSPFTLYIQLRT